MEHLNRSGDPSSELCKEVYAHYGLCVAASQLLETHLINMLNLYATSNDPTPTRQTYDRYNEKHEKLTFGNLVRAFDQYDYLSHFRPIVETLKRHRDFLAHRFFRERADDFVTIGGCMLLIEELDAIRDTFDKTVGDLESIETEVTRKVGVHTPGFRENCDRYLDQMMAAAKSKSRNEH